MGLGLANLAEIQVWTLERMSWQSRNMPLDNTPWERAGLGHKTLRRRQTLILLGSVLWPEGLWNHAVHSIHFEKSGTWLHSILVAVGSDDPQESRAKLNAPLLHMNQRTSYTHDS